jgi:hypothetical protein
MAQMNTGQKILLDVTTEDAAGFETDIAVAWTVDDPTVATLMPVEGRPQDRWAVSGAPGSTVAHAVVTLEDASTLEATIALDVVPAGTVLIEIVAGDPEPE